MTAPRRRRTLTPLQTELQFEEPEPETPPRRRLRIRRRHREPPKTLGGAVLAGLLRLAIAVGVASLAAGVIDHFSDRHASFGFYCVGAFILAAAVLMGTGMGSRSSRAIGSRETRVNLSFAYVLAGVLVVGIAVAIDAL